MIPTLFLVALGLGILLVGWLVGVVMGRHARAASEYEGAVS